MTDQFAEDLDKDPAGAWRPEPGNKLIGKLLSIVERISSYDGTTPYPVLEIADEETGEVLAVHVFHGVLLQKLQEQQPRIGERVGLKYKGQATTANGTRYHDYVLRVDRPDGTTAVDLSRYGTHAEAPSPATTAQTGFNQRGTPDNTPNPMGGEPTIAGTPVYQQILAAYEAAGNPQDQLVAWLDKNIGASILDPSTRVGDLNDPQGAALLNWLQGADA